MKKSLPIVFFSLAACTITTLMFLGSCKRDGGSYYNYAPKVEVFNGNVIEFLEKQTGYDSMLLVLRKYPDIVQYLNSGDSITLFAIPNQSFRLAVENFNIARAAIDSPRLYLSPSTYNLSRPDSGMFSREMLRILISRYIIPGYYDFSTVAQSFTGIPAKSYGYDYEMNMRAIQQSSTGSTKDGPKVIEFSDMNYSFFRQYWKPTNTISVNTTRAGNVIVHLLSSSHEFGYSSFISYMSDPRILREQWAPFEWSSQLPGVTRGEGGTVYHTLDNNLNTYWNSAVQPTPPFYFTMDMKKQYTVSGVGIQNFAEWSLPNTKPIEFYVEFAAANVNLSDSASWIRSDTFRLRNVNVNNLSDKYRFQLKEKVNARYFRFVPTNVWGGLAGVRQTSLAEIWMYF